MARLRRTTILGFLAIGLLLVSSAASGSATPPSAHQSSPSAVGPDFNGDGFSDLAIGVPREEPTNADLSPGAVNVLYGSPTGPSTAGDQLWWQDSAGIEDTAEPFDYFGSMLDAGDFNGDGFSDLVVVVGGENTDAGALNVIYGSGAGLLASGNQFWTQDSPGIGDSAETYDGFGSDLGVGDFDGDGFADLAVGVSSEDAGDVQDAGAVNVLYGGPSGLSAGGNQFWTQDSPGILETAEYGDLLGYSMAAGDFDGNGFFDLAVAAEGESFGSTQYAGAVTVLYGSPSGLIAAGNQLWSQDAPGVADLAEEQDHFGYSLAAADLDGDGYSDLAVGVPTEETGLRPNTGAIHFLFGSPTGLSALRDQLWTQDSPGVGDEAEWADWWGFRLAGGDFDGNGYGDVVVSAHYEDVGETVDAGGVNVLYGSLDGPSMLRGQFWSQDSTEVDGLAEYEDGFGDALFAGDLDGDGFQELLIGVPEENLRRTGNSGAINILYGSSSGLSAVGNELLTQDSPGVVEGAEYDDRFGTAVA